MKQNFTKFKPLPERKYDLNRFESYVHYLTNKERKTEPQWVCFAVLSPSLSLLVMETIKDHQNCECYICDIFDDEFDVSHISNLKHHNHGTF